MINDAWMEDDMPNPNDFLKRGFEALATGSLIVMSPMLLGYLFGPPAHVFESTVGFLMAIRWLFALICFGWAFLQFFSVRFYSDEREERARKQAAVELEGSMSHLDNRTNPPVSQRRPNPGSTVPTRSVVTPSDDSFSTSMVVSGLTGSTLAGLAVGGSVSGALTGELLHDAIENGRASESAAPPDQGCEVPAHEAPDANAGAVGSWSSNDCDVSSNSADFDSSTGGASDW